MLISSQGLGEEISNLDLNRKVVEGDYLGTNTTPYKMGIHANVLSQLMHDRIRSNLKSIGAITGKILYQRNINDNIRQPT